MALSVVSSIKLWLGKGYVARACTATISNSQNINWGFNSWQNLTKQWHSSEGSWYNHPQRLAVCSLSSDLFFFPVLTGHTTRIATFAQSKMSTSLSKCDLFTTSSRCWGKNIRIASLYYNFPPLYLSIDFGNIKLSFLELKKTCRLSYLIVAVVISPMSLWNPFWNYLYC